MTGPREGRILRCTWEKRQGAYHVWVRGRPQIRAAGHTFEVADEALYVAILDATGDGENLREYVPRAPGAAPVPGLAVEHVMVSGGMANIANLPELFAEGSCEQCGNPRGPRTETPLLIRELSSNFELGAATVGPARGPSLLLASDAFLRLLGVVERKRFEWRAVERPKGGKRKLFELVTSHAEVSRVSVHPRAVRLWGVTRRRAAGAGWICDTCGWVAEPVYWWGTDDLPTAFVAARAPLVRTASCFTIGRAPDYRLCFRQERWEQLRGSTRARGCKTNSLGSLAPRLVGPTERRRHSVVWAEHPSAPSAFEMISGRKWFGGPGGIQHQEEPAGYYPMLHRTLAAVAEGPPDADEDIAGLAAAEVVAALRGRPLKDLKAAVVDWVHIWITRAPMPRGLTALARRAVARVARRSPAAKEWTAWKQAVPWKNYLADLRRRLA